MLTTDVIHTMIAYNYAYQRRLWESIMTLTDAQFAADIPYSLGSIRTHMTHLASVDTRWLMGIKEMPGAREFNYEPQEYPTRESVRALCEAAAAAVIEYAATATEADLARLPQRIPLTVWQILLHVVNHGTDHRAQVLRALHDLGAPTFGQDLVFYLFER